MEQGSETRTKFSTESTMSIRWLSISCHDYPPRRVAIFSEIIEVAGASLPMDALFADLGGDTGSVVGSATSEEALRYAALTTFDHLLKTAGTRGDVLTIMRVAEPFRSNWRRTAQILGVGDGEEQENE